MMQFLKYIIFGLINTVVGFGVFFALFRIFNISVEYANAAGYGFALIIAFILNKVFVFNKSISNRNTIPKFIIAFIFSFIINQLVLMFFYRLIGLSAEISQTFAMVSYTFLFYFLNKNFVFSDKARGR
jgi:putative flippase GtrA